MNKDFLGLQLVSGLLIAVCTTIELLYENN